MSLPCLAFLGFHGIQSRLQRHRSYLKQGSRYFFGPILFSDPKIFFWPKIFFRPKIIFRPKIYGPKIFFGTNFFSEQSFFRNTNFSDPKFFSDLTFFADPKWTSWKMIFGGRKQSFWTWGCLNWQGQRFYFNWSLTLETKSCLRLSSYWRSS